jgi:mannose-6-phosphate isomerase-like protein (cupin superfamily)
MDAYFLDHGQGDSADLGVARMRLLLSHKQSDGAFSAAEFRGSAGPWTVPHVHRACEEYFYVLEGVFRFTCGGEELDAVPGSFLMVPRGTEHVFRAESEGALMVLWTPGGLEQMFLELSRLGADGLTDPAMRAKVGERFDSIPVRREGDLPSSVTSTAE